MKIIPHKKQAILNTFFVTIFFGISLSGQAQNIAFQAINLFIACTIALFTHRKSLRHLFSLLKTPPWVVKLMGIWLIAVFASLALTILNSPSDIQTIAAIARTLYMLLMIALFISLLYQAQFSHLSFNKLFNTFSAGAVVLILIQASAIVYTGIENADSWEWFKYPLLGTNIRECGMMAIAAYFISYSQLLLINSSKSTHSVFSIRFISFLILSTFCLSYILWTGGRMSIATTLFTSLFLTLFCITKYKQSPLTFIIFIFITISSITISSLLSIFDWNGLSYLTEKLNESSSNELTSRRLEIWQWSITAIKESPWIGHGPYSFYFLEERQNSTFIYDHPHNFILQMSLEWGVIATICLLTSLAYLYLQAIKVAIKSQAASLNASLAIITALTIHGLTGATYWSPQPVTILIACYACICYHLATTNKQQ